MRAIRPAALATALLSILAVVGGRPSDAIAAGPDGARLYRALCAGCHGTSGTGNGPDAAIFADKPRNLRTGFLNKYNTDVLVQRVRDGRALPLYLDPAALRQRAKEVEALVTYLQRIPTIDWPLVTHGRDIYAEHCALCHGPYGRPEKHLPPGVQTPRDLSDPAVQHSIHDADLIPLVQHGRQGMPALTPRVPEAGGAPLAAFVRGLSPGFTLYDRYCVNCHGPSGRSVGAIGGELKSPKVVFDREYFQRRDPEQLRATVWHMAEEKKPTMPHYRWTLDEDQATAIVEYLKATEANAPR